MLRTMRYYYATHNSQLAVHLQMGALSRVSSVSPPVPALSVVMLLKTTFTIIGISALVNEVSSASVSALDCDPRCCFPRDGVWPAFFLFAAVQVVTSRSPLCVHTLLAEWGVASKLWRWPLPLDEPLVITWLSRVLSTLAPFLFFRGIVSLVFRKEQISLYLSSRTFLTAKNTCCTFRMCNS